MADTYKVVKRCGQFTEPLLDAPEFSDRSKAEEWAKRYLADHPADFPKGITAIEVTPVHRAKGD